jgi:hypothetical protein
VRVGPTANEIAASLRGSGNAPPDGGTQRRDRAIEYVLRLEVGEVAGTGDYDVAGAKGIVSAMKWCA